MREVDSQELCEHFGCIEPGVFVLVGHTRDDPLLGVKTTAACPLHAAHMIAVMIEQMLDEERITGISVMLA
jgi:hypothetical protein